jgi:pilus assembly protein CpaE
MARILVIDDDLDLLQMTRLMLQRGGHEVIVTADGADGIAKAQQLHPDMAIIDVMMPQMNGYQVVRRLREDPATADIVALILTARAQPVDRDAAMAAQADDYMAKPVAPAELLKKVSELLSRGAKAALPSKVVVALFSLRGGAGVTTLAVNLGMAFQQASRRTCVVDLSTRSGHVAMHLRLQAKAGWADLLSRANVLTPDMVDKVLLKHEKSGLKLLASPFLPPTQPIGPEALDKVIGVLKPMFDSLLLDVSGSIDGVTRLAFNAADYIMTVMTPEVASLQTTAATLRTFGALNVPDARVVLVVNQVMPRPGLSAQAIEKALSRQVKASIPYDEGQMQAMGQGTPILQSNPDAPLATAVKQLVELFAQQR